MQTPLNILPNQPYERKGDKANSDFFEEHLLKIYDARDKSGLSGNYQNFHHVVVEVELGGARNYISELLVMTPYNYLRSFEDDAYRYHLLRINNDTPDYIVREQLNQNQHSKIWSLNQLSKNGRMKPFTRYIGEVINVKDLSEVHAKLTAWEIRFSQELPANRSKNHILWTEESIYTWNFTGYIQEQSREKEYDFVKEWSFDTETIALFEKMKKMQADLEIDKYVLPIDHLATRVYMHDREHAILEFLTLSSYYFWGAYNIGDQNSSTNIARNIHGFTEIQSPAKVFTANNTPYYVKHINGLPSPTENFVRNFGRRMHHIAYAVKDGKIGPEENDYKYVDFVVDQLKKCEKEFLDDVIGSCEEGLKQIFSKSSLFSYIITEYIQRCDDYEGFFTIENVAALTAAAGQDDMVN